MTNLEPYSYLRQGQDWANPLLHQHILEWREMVRRQVTMIVATGVTASPLAAKAATATIPIVFLGGGDPIKLGLVSSFNRPTGNLTGVTWPNNTMAAKRLELLHQLMPAAKTIGLLVNPANPNASAETADILVAARGLGLQMLIQKCQYRSRHRRGLRWICSSARWRAVHWRRSALHHPARSSGRAGGPTRASDVSR
jgi:hypothetical protein